MARRNFFNILILPAKMSSDSEENEFTPESRANYREKRVRFTDNKSKYCKDAIVNKKQFYSDLEVQNFMKNYVSTTNENFYERDCQNKKFLVNKKRRHGNAKVTFRHISYLCVHGPSRTSESTGQRKT